MINFKKFTARDYKFMLMPSIIVSLIFEAILLWNFADCLLRGISAFRNFPNIAAEKIPDSLYLHLCSMIDSFFLALAFAFGITILYSVQKSSTPFTAYVGKGMRIISVSIILGYVLKPLVKLVISNILAAPAIETINYFGIGCLPIMGLTFILSFIFDYGCELQRESDETL